MILLCRWPDGIWECSRSTLEGVTEHLGGEMQVEPRGQYREKGMAWWDKGGYGIETCRLGATFDDFPEIFRSWLKPVAIQQWRGCRRSAHNHRIEGPLHTTSANMRSSQVLKSGMPQGERHPSLRVIRWNALQLTSCLRALTEKSFVSPAPCSP